MENFKAGKNVERSYYLENQMAFSRLSEVINLMPSIAVGEIKDTTHTDFYYETREYFLKELNATIRVRRSDTKQTLSIVCNNLQIRKEFEMEMEVGSEITDRDEYVIFLEDKLQYIYTHRLNVDVIRVLKGLRPFIVMNTSRKEHSVFDNKDFKCEVDFDDVTIETKKYSDKIYVLEIKLLSYPTVENVATFERFVKELEKRVVLIPMNEKKLNAGMRVFNRES